MKKLAIVFSLLVLIGRTDGFAFGLEGHAVVGAIADVRLAGTPTEAKVKEWLDGLTLEQAAVLADRIKGWDKYGPDVPGIFAIPDHPAIEKQLKEFVRANPPPKTPRSEDDSDPAPSHHWFHYTDIPLEQTSYSQGKHGRSKWDVVRTISYCVGVLSGEVPEDNPRKITKPVAVILLAHYVGDIHQPLHVGAQYFDRQGNPVNPEGEGVTEALEDQGGNSLFMVLKTPMDNGNSKRPVTMHGYWDGLTVKSVVARIGAEISRQDPAHAAEYTPREIAAKLAAIEPLGWNSMTAEEPARWSELWANETLPLAREAHARLHYTNILPKESYGSTIASGFVHEKEMPDGRSYADWSRDVIAEQLTKAGFRLAALLEKNVGKDK